MPKFPKHINEQVTLAAIYFEDGAPHTAADRLQAAADAMRQIASARDAYIAGLMQKDSHT